MKSPSSEFSLILDPVGACPLSGSIWPEICVDNSEMDQTWANFDRKKTWQRNRSCHGPHNVGQFWPRRVQRMYYFVSFYYSVNQLSLSTFSNRVLIMLPKIFVSTFVVVVVRPMQFNIISKGHMFIIMSNYRTF